MTPKSFSQHDNSNEVISRQVTYCTTFFRKIFHTWNFMRLVLGPVAFCQAHFLFRAKKKHEHFLFVFWNKTSRVNIVQTVSDRRSPNSFSFVGWLQEWDARRTVRGCCWQTFVLHSCTEANFAGAFTSNIIYLLSLYFDFLYLFPTINIWNIQPLQIFSGGFDWH